MSVLKRATEFNKWKSDILSRADLSKKGSIDSAIENLVKFINEQDGYCTTSCCSGRIVVFSTTGTDSSSKETDETFSEKSKSCIWHLISHYKVSLSEVLDSINCIKCESKLKFEGFIMHVKCGGLEEARLMLNAAVSSGYRNSGITLGKRGRNIMVAVRGTYCLEIPLTDAVGRRLTSDEYIDYVVKIANVKFKENAERSKKFEAKLQTLICNHNRKTQTPMPIKPPRPERSKNLRDSPAVTDNNQCLDDIQFLFVGE